MSRRRPQAGFSLLEIMLAVSLLALLVTAVSVTWNAALSGWKRSSRMTEIFQRERIVLGSLAELTQSMVFYRARNGLYDLEVKSEAEGGPSISFVTSSTALLPATDQGLGGLRRVSIALVQDHYGRPYLGIRNQPSLVAGETDQAEPFAVFSAEVSGLAFRFRHPRTKSWEDQWQEKGLLPEAIEYSVTFGGDDPRLTAVTAVRQVDLPGAAFTMSTGGATPSELSGGRGGARGSSSRGGR